MKRNRYTRRINDRKYYVHIAEFGILPYVKVVVNDSYSTERCTTFVKERKWFCEDVQRFAANKLSEAVQIREDNIQEEQQYDENINRALDIVQEEYDEGEN